ncbi:peptidoglycan-binding domain-containing protein [Iningainema tapete]|uniref:Peptidoglycan-binding protein n=1 Tax=Iningainema tapete BLCC-T55 TaxID=2748662 RepID=A0A8J6Y2V2_9CYAN|nr:peptidoglycan-binding domain-containing protein [Iningainema tapete]MBD2778528.1 peptidoglycan-binding protein [Iningainema tapete BLCC-T55]
MQIRVNPTANKQMPELRKGDTGEAVRFLQNVLVALDYLNSDLVTGSYLDITEQAVRNFQVDYGLRVDGIVGNNTWRVLGGLLWD